MSKLIALPILLAIALAAQKIDDNRYAREKLVLRQVGVSATDETALLKTLRQREKPWIADSAAYCLGRLPKSELAIRELNAATMADYEWLSLDAMEALMGWGDSQWVSAAKSRLRNYKDEAVRLSVAGLLARAGVFDGWDLVETTIMANSRYRDIALSQVLSFKNVKDSSGQPIDLVKRLDAMRSSSSSKVVRDRLLEKIIQLSRPVQGVEPQERKR